MSRRQTIVELATDLCVTAGAGAGKTSCLVETYVRLLLKPPAGRGLEPENIAAITFTEKAALEMRGRIQNKLAELARQGDKRADWNKLAARVEWAPISTIHSFCLAILREFGVYLGLDQDFQVLDESEYQELAQETAREVVRQALRQTDPALATLLNFFPVGGSQGVEGQLVRLGYLLNLHGLSPSQVGRGTRRAYEELQARRGEWLSLWQRLMGRLAEELERLLKERLLKKRLKKSDPPQYTGRVQSLLDYWRDHKNSLPEAAPDQALPHWRNMWKFLNGGFGPKNKALWEDCKRALGGLCQTDDCRVRQAGAALLVLGEKFINGMELELERRAALSFDHLLLKTRDLLRDFPEARQALRQRWAVLMVDEFQDVNPLQAELISLLAAPDPEPRPRLLLMGDIKQSIYAFRGAQAGLFGKMIQAFQTAAGQQAIYLEENFRSSPDLIDFFNTLFPALSQEAPQPDPAWEHLQARQIAGRKRNEAEPAGEGVGILDCRSLGEEGLPIGTWRRLEAEALADYLAGLVSRGKYRPQDIVLLFQRLTNVGIYERALRDRGLSFYTVRGRGFYECQEIIDLIFSLLALLDPEDEAALAVLLTSPFLDMTYDRLFRLAHPQAREFKSLRKALGELAAAGPKDQEPRSLALWRQWAALAPHLKLADLIQLLLESADLPPFLAAQENGAQKIANIRKLLENVRREGHRPSQAVVEQWKELQMKSDEPQAPLLSEDAPLIRLMSVHQAKGLEFPLVVLADLSGSGSARDSYLLLNAQGLLGIKLPGVEADPLYAALREREDMVRLAEQARLFYVACTRARESLLFVLSGKKLEAGALWQKWTQELVLPLPEVRAYQPGERTEAKSPSPLSTEDLPLPESPHAQAAAIWRKATAPAPPRTLLRETVSGLEDWLECPRRWYFSRYWGLDSALISDKNFKEKPSQDIQNFSHNLLKGQLTHQILREADFSRPAARLEEVWQRLPGRQMYPEALKEQVLRLAAQFWQTPLWELLQNAPPEFIHREQPFSFILKADPHLELEVRGDMDLIFRTGSPAWHIVDYKVSAHSEPEHYRIQMLLYALALSQESRLEGGREIPSAVLCTLNDQGAHCHDYKFKPEDLAVLGRNLAETARIMSSLPVDLAISHLPGPEVCPTACSLAALCPYSGSAHV